ncbi:3-hydroxyacyl-ACP dehydratase FabZ [Candidatus Xianfuyuplasma coldseepsis]|uniref:3-hydroxyacyl-[acyl-carrier-protein] dehydratase FabZ n=1 Tax=Candidatus Xianfuyuplasma coldseepsis TaxID=2782163 RepID=A0A7L7KSQ1_9MOLU|nr:3-hydroxyacyl-ACP dehydratase FabZ [Xianfuyuplasma coldseepsis]QMS85439.1 3-hydroxyacyl-ACP dehydratase FabZ [Xianfuyuplasma coldseepsis]
MELNSNQIQEIIPHRYPFLLIDKVVELEPGHSCKAIKNVSANEMQFMGHFPQEHVMPGVLMVEALAQAGAVIILSVPENKGKIAYFAGIDKCKFKQKVVPGDTLELNVEIVRQKGPIGFGTAVATVNGKVAVQAELKFAVGE